MGLLYITKALILHQFIALYSLIEYNKVYDFIK